MKLFNWQEPYLERIVNAQQRENVAVLATCTGSGKTPLGLVWAKEIGRRPVIIAPKATLPQWWRACEAWDVKPAALMNIELLRTGKQPLLEKRGNQFIWKINRDKCCIIFDEARNLMGLDTQNGAILKATRSLIKLADGSLAKCDYPTLMMTATFAQSPLCLRDAVGDRLKFHDGEKTSGPWLMAHGCYVRRIPPKTIVLPNGKTKVIPEKNFYEFPRDGRKLPYLDKLNKELFPRFGVACKQSDIPNFPKSTLIIDTYPVDEKLAKDAGMYEAYERLAERKLQSVGGVFPERLYDKMMAEIAKVSTLEALVRASIEEGNSPVVFLNHKEPLYMLQERLSDLVPCVHHGDNTKEREAHVQRFLRDETRVALVTIASGGSGLELDDKLGTYPRETFISPPDAAYLFIQVLGRTNRTTSKSGVTQRLVLAEGTVEEQILINLKNKMFNMERITDMSHLEAVLTDEDLLL